MSYAVKEIFLTLQGEGAHAGRAAVFCRFSGCNLWSGREEDRAKARGFVERCAITVMGGLPPRELARVCEITPLTGPEQELVTSWSAPDSWQPGAKHPGRGKYLIKTGERLGIPVELSLVGDLLP